MLHSVPDWLAELWWNELGPERARALLASVNTPAESAIRVEHAASTPEQVQAALTDPTRPARPLGPAWDGQPDLPELPEVLVIDGAFDAFGSELFKQGR